MLFRATCVLHTYAREVLSSSAQAGVEARFSELEELAASRYLHLVEFKQLHQFERECDEVEQWIMEKLAVANNEELGKDLEHVEVLFTTCTALLKMYTVSNITLSNYTFATCTCLYGTMYRSCTALLKFYTVSNITLSNYTFATCTCLYGTMYRSPSNCVFTALHVCLQYACTFVQVQSVHVCVTL